MYSDLTVNVRFALVDENCGKFLREVCIHKGTVVHTQLAAFPLHPKRFSEGSLQNNVLVASVTFPTAQDCKKFTEWVAKKHHWHAQPHKSNRVADLGD